MTHTMNTTTINRMDIFSVAAFFFKKGMRQTGHFMLGCIIDDSVTLDGKWIDASFVERHVGLGSLLWRELQSTVTTWMPEE